MHHLLGEYLSYAHLVNFRDLTTNMYVPVHCTREPRACAYSNPVNTRTRIISNLTKYHPHLAGQTLSNEKP